MQRHQACWSYLESGFRACMEKIFTDNSIIANITRIDDLHLNLLSYLPIQNVLALTQISRYYYAVHNEVHVWKRLLKREFNWPPVRRGKGSKKQKKAKNEMTVAELKPIFIQKYKELQPKDDQDLIQLIRPLFVNLYNRHFGDNYQICYHHPLTFVPVNARKPQYFGCAKCRCRMELNGGMTKGQMREMFEFKTHYSNGQYITALCSPDIEIYHVADLEQLRP